MSRTWVPSLWKQITGNTNRSLSRNRQPRRTRLCVETLEDRTTPAVLFVTSPLDLPVYFGPTGNLLPINGGTLRYELTQANIDAAHGISDAVGFNFTKPQTIWLQLGQLELGGAGGSISVDGANLVTIDGLNASRIFHVGPGAQATLSDLTITHGYASLGGGILDEGVLHLNNAILKGNSAIGSQGRYGDGGAIEVTGQLTLNGVTFTSNMATYYGGAIDVASTAGQVSMTGTTFSANHSAAAFGGALANGGAQTTVSYSTFAGNWAENGGAIENETTGNLTVNNGSNVYGNTANGSQGLYGDGGAIDNLGVLALANVDLWGNSATYYGGAINVASTAGLGL